MKYPLTILGPVLIGLSSCQSCEKVPDELFPEVSIGNDTTELLTMTDIYPDLLERTRAKAWMTNLPGYIFGLSRGSGNGKSGLGIGFTDSLGTWFGCTVSEIQSAEWTVHDGKSFGSQQVTLGLATNRPIEINWISTSEDEVFFSLTEVPNGVGPFLFFEELRTSKGDSETEIEFVDHLGDEWVLSFNQVSYTGLVQVPSTEEYPGWMSPASMASMIKNWDESQSAGHYVPAEDMSSPWQALSFAFFRNLSGETVFRIKRKGATAVELPISFPTSLFEEKRSFFLPDKTHWARKAISTLMGSLGRFAGTVVIRDPGNIVTPVPSPYLEMTSIGPSRSKFPRPFLWDEGFHLLAVDTVNRPLAVEIVTSWLRAQSVTMERGWIPRELALSQRDRAAIPGEFLPQDPMIANPTTLVFVIRKWLAEEGLLTTTALTKIGSHLVRWYQHLETYQKSDHKPETCFRWKDRTSAHCLSSGLDDFPRGLLVNLNECHLDLHVWLMILVDTIRTINKQVALKTVSGNCDSVYSQMLVSMRSVFTVSGFNVMADYIGNQFVGRGGEILLKEPWRDDGLCGGAIPCDPSSPCCDRFGMCRPDFVCDCPDCVLSSLSPLRDQKLNGFTLEPSHSPHLGYVNLFPFILGRLDPVTDKGVIKTVVDVLLRDDLLLSSYGILSLARDDAWFARDENYWRGNIWANINLLTVGALQGYERAYTESDPELASALREKALVVSNNWKTAMKRAWTESNGPREYLTPLTGEGGGAMPFGGWTAATMFLLESNESFWTTTVGLNNNS